MLAGLLVVDTPSRSSGGDRSTRFSLERGLVSVSIIVAIIAAAVAPGIWRSRHRP